MTTDDLAWVQSRLRNCINARRQLRICAECLYVDEGTLLESLGYASLDAFRAAHPQNKRSCGPPVERICNPVPPEMMMESILFQRYHRRHRRYFRRTVYRRIRYRTRPRRHERLSGAVAIVHLPGLRIGTAEIS